MPDPYVSDDWSWRDFDRYNGRYDDDLDEEELEQEREDREPSELARNSGIRNGSPADYDESEECLHGVLYCDPYGCTICESQDLEEKS